MTDIDDTDYALLTAIATVDGPAWKKRIQDQLQEQSESLPGNADLSLQTVGRRINVLRDKGLVSTVIVHPPDIPQNLIIGYTLTDKGRRVLDEKRGDIIESYVGRMDHDLPVADKDILLKMLDDDLDLSDAEYAALQEQDGEALRVFTALYRALHLVDDKIDEQTAETFFDIIQRRRGHDDNRGQGVVTTVILHG